MRAEVCPGHVHMLVEILPKLSVSSFMEYLKGKSAAMLDEQIWRTEIQILGSRILVPRILRGYGGQEYKSHSGIHCEPI